MRSTIKGAFICVSVLIVLAIAAQDGRAQILFSAISGTPERTRDVAVLRKLEEQIEQATVSGDVGMLQTVLADDFTYARTTGEVDNKTVWLRTVARRPFSFRKIVAVDIEVHGNVAITRGKLDMAVRDEHGDHRNLIIYLHVYEHRDGHWQMLTHRSLAETSTPLS